MKPGEPFNIELFDGFSARVAPVATFLVCIPTLD